jgi:hypothetical protein
MKLEKLINAIDIAIENKDIKTLAGISTELTNLLSIVERIPYYCGNPNCTNVGCLSVRETRDCARELINKYGKAGI